MVNAIKIYHAKEEGSIYNTFEVFGGAGWVLFGKEVGKELEVFNDADSNLINLYRCIKYHCEELQNGFRIFPLES